MQFKVGRFIFTVNRWGVLTPAAFDAGSERVTRLPKHWYVGMWRRSW